MALQLAENEANINLCHQSGLLGRNPFSMVIMKFLGISLLPKQLATADVCFIHKLTGKTVKSIRLFLFAGIVCRCSITSMSRSIIIIVN